VAAAYLHSFLLLPIDSLQNVVTLLHQILALVDDLAARMRMEVQPEYQPDSGIATFSLSPRRRTDLLFYRHAQSTRTRIK
jgi:hypothetical protein